MIDKARTNLVENRNLVKRMQVSLGVSSDADDEDSAFDNFNQVFYPLFWVYKCQTHLCVPSPDCDAIKYYSN